MKNRSRKPQPTAAEQAACLLLVGLSCALAAPVALIAERIPEGTVQTLIILLGAITSVLIALVMMTAAQRLRASGGARRKGASTSRPPRWGQFLLHCFSSRAKRQELIDELADEFQDRRLEYGDRMARLWYWTQVALSLWPLLTGLILGLVKLINKIVR